MSRILLLDASTTICRCGLVEGNELAVWHELNEPMQHASMLTVLAQQALSGNSANAVAITLGPGSYTGLRIAASVAKGYAFGAQVPLLAIPTLDLLARAMVMASRGHDIPEGGVLMPVMDARRMEVYSATYSAHGERLTPDQALVVNSEADLQGAWIGGDGSPKLVEAFGYRRVLEPLPLGQAFAALALSYMHDQKFADATYLEPHYLKAFTPGAKG